MERSSRPSPESASPVRPRRDGGVLRDIVSVHTVTGVLLGIGAGIWAISVHKVLQDEATILLAVMGAAVALLAVILAAVAIMAGFLSGFFGEVIETAARPSLVCRRRG
jgi:Photosystem II protein.